MQKNGEILSVEFDESSQSEQVCVTNTKFKKPSNVRTLILPPTHQSAPPSSTVPPIWLFPVSEFYTNGLIPYIFFFVQLILLSFYL